MTRREGHEERKAPSDATIRSVLRAAIGAYRRRFRRVAIAAVIIFVPMDLLVTLSTDAGRRAAEAAEVLAAVLAIAVSAASVSGTIIGLTFFAGILDRIVAVDQHSHEDAPPHEIVRHLPFTRLVVASFVATALIAAGFVAFIVPGSVLLVLWSILGPLIVIEDLRVFPALPRSARLVWPHFLLALVVVAIPTPLEDVPLSMLERFSWYEQPLVRVPVDVLATRVLGGVIGVIEVTLAHALIADEKRRRESAT